jgi:hypothetical protein
MGLNSPQNMQGLSIGEPFPLAKDQSDQYSEKETAKRMEDAIRRAQKNAAPNAQGYCRKEGQESQAQSEKGEGLDAAGTQ